MLPFKYELSTLISSPSVKLLSLSLIPVVNLATNALVYSSKVLALTLVNLHNVKSLNVTTLASHKSSDVNPTSWNAEIIYI